MDERKYQFESSIVDYRGSILFSLAILVVMHWIAYSKSGQMSLQPFIGAISFALVFLPLITVFKHRKYSIVINNGIISGYDLNSKKRVSEDISTVVSFGVEKGSAKTDPRNHLALVDHVFINLSSGERLVVFLKANRLKELLDDLGQLKDD